MNRKSKTTNILLATYLLVTLSSCGTILTLSNNAKYKAAPYSGTRYDLNVSGFYGNVDEMTRVWWAPFAFTDIPGSFFMDTLVLPYTGSLWLYDVVNE